MGFTPQIHSYRICTARPGLDHLGASTTQSVNDVFTCFKIKKLSKQIFKINMSWIITEHDLSYKNSAKV